MGKLSVQMSICLLIMFNLSCKKDSPEPDDDHEHHSDVESVHVHGSVAHHGRKIPLAKVYYKIGTQEFPGKEPASYDQRVECDSLGVFHLDDLAPSEYYFYAIGWDSGINDSVFGGIPVQLNETEKSIEVPVTE